MGESIRVLKMVAAGDRDLDGKTAAQVQDEFFLDALRARDGRYQFRKVGLKASTGTIVLFQFESHIIARAVYQKRKDYLSPEINDTFQYYGELVFDPSSIQVFDRVSPESMKQIWSNFNPSMPGMPKLDADLYPAFVGQLKNIRPESVPLEEEADEGHYKSDNTDERPTTSRQIRLRRGAKKFREILQKRFDATCLVTGCKVRDLLEAAHIHPHRGTKDDHPENGLLLRSDIHTMFDLYLLAIEPEQMTIQIHPKLLHDDYYGQFHGKTLKCTDETRPSKVELKARYQEFQRKMAAGSPSVP